MIKASRGTRGSCDVRKPIDHRTLPASGVGLGRIKAAKASGSTPPLGVERVRRGRISGHPRLTKSDSAGESAA